jgi:23S rRNA (uracil1939-C5)-methyltransferase
MKNRQIRFGRPKAARQTLPDEPIELTIERMSQEGRGVAKRDGKTVFVDGALPGERVTARIDKQHKRYDEATATAINEASDDRLTPFCPSFNECGGCQLQHLSSEKQLEYKLDNVLNQLSRMSEIVPSSIEAPLQSPTQEYRRAARVGINVLQRSGEVITGFRRAQSNKLTAIDHCPVLISSISDLIVPLRDCIAELDNPKRFTQMECLQSSDTLLVGLRCKGRLKGEDTEQLTAFAKANKITLRVTGDHGNLLIHSEGQAHLTESGLTLACELGDFVQINPHINEQMIQKAIEWLSPNQNDVILDLFCGLGNFSLPLAKHAGQVIGVEGGELMVKRATQNAQLNQLDNCTFYCADLTQPPEQHEWFNQKANKLVLDPPRAGAFELVQALSPFAEKILYVSCEPSALARDAKVLKEKGYTLSKFTVMDMFPHTSHIESIALFEK